MWYSVTVVFNHPIFYSLFIVWRRWNEGLSGLCGIIIACLVSPLSYWIAAACCGCICSRSHISLWASMTFQCTDWVAGGRCGSCEATSTDYAYPKNRSPSFGRKACKWNSNAAILFSSLLILTILVEYLCYIIVPFVLSEKHIFGFLHMENICYILVWICFSSES